MDNKKIKRRLKRLIKGLKGRLPGLTIYFILCYISSRITTGRIRTVAPLLICLLLILLEKWYTKHSNNKK